MRLRIEAAARSAGREPGGIRLLAATKGRTAAEVLEAIEAGVDLIGENRVQELIEKEPSVRGMAEVHFIGHLQRNKVRHLVGLVSLIHSVDSLRLAREIDSRAMDAGLVQEVLLQVNVAGEDTKSGVPPGELRQFALDVAGLENVEVVGLSTIAPFAPEPGDVRPVFAELRVMGRQLSEVGIGCRELSMGMTNDYEVAIEEGSTIVRVGTALFGPRAGV